MDALIVLILCFFFIFFFLFKTIQIAGKIKRQHRLLNFRGEGSFFGLIKNYFLLVFYSMMVVFTGSLIDLISN